jgi:hypothetical protein
MVASVQSGLRAGVVLCAASVEGRGTWVERKVLVGQEMIDFTISIACAHAKTALDDVDLLLLLMSIHVQPLNHPYEFCKAAGNIALQYPPRQMHHIMLR